MGIEQLEKLAKNGAKVATAVVNKSGVFSILGSVLEFSTIDWKKLAPEAGDIDAAELVSLQKLLSDNFEPNDKSLDLKFDELLSLAKKSYEIGQKAVATGIDVYDTARELVKEWQSFFDSKKV